MKLNLFYQGLLFMNVRSEKSVDTFPCCFITTR